MNQNIKFILSPVSDILNEGVSSVKNIKHGIETHPLSDYILQSILIKMAGAQEQKIKCILWEMANNNHNFRYTFLNNNLSKSGCSQYKDKNDVYKFLIEQIKITSPNFDFVNTFNKLKKEILSYSNISNTVENSLFYYWSQRGYTTYLDYWKTIKESYFAIDCKNILGEHLKQQYEDSFYKNRNRIAHNTRSYQQNLPSLNTLVKEDYPYENYFIWFSLLILIDKIFMELYKIYLEELDCIKFI
ncbi:MAG: hypothetical protein Q4A60_02735 [Pasteurellaceae bacterium]|nr:hypothetical protein [Pasteurellaceae bacterium]